MRLNDFLNAYNDPEGVHTTMSKLMASEGVLAGARIGSCFWFVMGEVSLHAPKLPHPFQRWCLHKIGDRALVMVESREGEIIFQKELGVTKFEYPGFEVLVEDGVIVLPSESKNRKREEATS